jgi:hypothetical protein
MWAANIAREYKCLVYVLYFEKVKVGLDDLNSVCIYAYVNPP